MRPSPLSSQPSLLPPEKIDAGAGQSATGRRVVRHDRDIDRVRRRAILAHDHIDRLLAAVIDDRIGKSPTGRYPSGRQSAYDGVFLCRRSIPSNATRPSPLSSQPSLLDRPARSRHR